MAKHGAPKIQDWKRLILYNGSTDNPRPRKITANATTILVHDPAWAGVLAYDEFAETIITRKLPPWRAQDAPTGCKVGDWCDEDTIRVQSWLSDAWGLDLGIEQTLAGVKVAAARSRIHPVREWLESLKWDGKRRVRSWLTDIMGCDDTPYVRECGSSFFVSAVARAMNPGCKVDTTIILEGEQGSGKSSCIRALAGDEWFLEMSITDVANKDAMQVLKRKWIAELPEIDGLSRTEWSHVKAYFSRQVDTYRPSYGKGARDFPRQTVFAGSTNRSDYLGDETGARRFYPVRVRACNLALARELRPQLWAEAVAMFQSNVAWHVTDPELLAAFKEQQGERFRPHPWEEKIAQWLERPIDLPAGTTRASVGVTTGDVLEGACRVDTSRQTDGDSKVVASCLRRLGWEQGKVQRDPRRNGARVRLFFPKNSQVDAHPEEATSGVRELVPEPANDEPGWPTDEDFRGLGE